MRNKQTIGGPRTFGDIIRMRHQTRGTCSFCKCYGSVRRYSTRHYICDPCVDPRVDVVLPSVIRYERLQRRLAALAQK